MRVKRPKESWGNLSESTAKRQEKWEILEKFMGNIREVHFAQHLNNRSLEGAKKNRREHFQELKDISF